MDETIISNDTKYEWISNMKLIFENWRKHLSEATNISAKFSGVDLSQMSSRDLYRLDGDVAAALGALGINVTDPDADFESTPEVDELMKQRRDLKIAIMNSEKASGARIKGHLEEKAVPHSAEHVVKKMRKTGLSAKEALKSFTDPELSDEEADRWLRRNKDKMDAAEEKLDRKKEMD